MGETRESENFRNLSRYSGAMVRAAVGLGEMQNDVVAGVHLQFSLVDVGAAALHHSLEADLAFVVAHTSSMVLGHRRSESALESSRIAAWHGIPSLPSDGLHSFLQNLDGRIRIVCECPILALGHRDYGWAAVFASDLRSRLLTIQQSEL